VEENYDIDIPSLWRMLCRRCPDDPWSSRIGQCWPGMTYLVIVADEGMNLELENMLN
jgi:hypothetical protein